MLIEVIAESGFIRILGRMVAIGSSPAGNHLVHGGLEGQIQFLQLAVAGWLYFPRKFRELVVWQ